MMPPTPNLTALLSEIDALVKWWCAGPWWHYFAFSIVFFVFGYAFFGGLRGFFMKGCKCKG